MVFDDLWTVDGRNAGQCDSDCGRPYGAAGGGNDEADDQPGNPRRATATTGGSPRTAPLRSPEPNRGPTSARWGSAPPVEGEAHWT